MRLRGYPKGSRLMMWQPCPNTKDMEKTILNRLDKKFQKKPEYGREYFEGEESEIISEINESIRAKAALDRTKAAISRPEILSAPLSDIRVDDFPKVLNHGMDSSTRGAKTPGVDIDWNISPTTKACAQTIPELFESFPSKTNPLRTGVNQDAEKTDPGEQTGKDIMWMCIVYLTLVIVMAKMLEIFGFG